VGARRAAPLRPPALAREDQHYWNAPTGTDPRSSLQATKRQGYDTNNDGRGDGWAARNAMGYRALRDYGSWPDFSDQVIEVSIRPFANTTERDALRAAMIAERAACGISSTADLPPATPPPPPPAPETQTEPEDETNDYNCPCSNNALRNGKIGILHRPPGNPSNEQLKCIAASGWNGHRNHDDLILCRAN
jgi:hypothetical protein